MPKRNPQDATLRNITALKKRVAILEFAVKELMRAYDVVLPLYRPKK